MLPTETALLELTEQLSATWFQRPFAGKVCWNSRLRTSAGRFAQKTRTIELNPRHAAHFGYSALEETIKHELIHCHFPGAGHGPVFRREAVRIGCARYCQPIPGLLRIHVYQCEQCGAKFRRRRRFDTRKFRCASCQGIIRLLETRTESIGGTEPKAVAPGGRRRDQKGRK